MAPAIFRSVMDRVLHNLPVACYLDDILIAAPTVREHDVLLEKGTTMVTGQWNTFARRKISNCSRASGVSGPCC